MQALVSQKAQRIKLNIAGHSRRLGLASQTSPMKKVGIEQPDRATLDLTKDEVLVQWNQLADYFVAAHEKHSVFVEAQSQAHFASSKVVHDTERYVGCDGDKLGDVHAAWEHAIRSDERAASKLLEAWASTLAAHERLTMAIDAGLLHRLSDSAALHDEDYVHIACGSGFQHVAQEAHKVGVRATDRALWPLLEQVLVLERLAKFQEAEMATKKLVGVSRKPITPVLDALFKVATAVADPTTRLGRSTAAKALNLVGPIVCPAPADCVGMLLMNSSSDSGQAWTAESPGRLLMEGARATSMAVACGPHAEKAWEAEVAESVSIVSAEENNLEGNSLIKELLREVRQEIRELKRQEHRDISDLERREQRHWESSTRHVAVEHQNGPADCLDEGCSDKLPLGITMLQTSTIQSFLEALR